MQYLQTVQICATIQTFMIRQHLPRRPKALPWSGYTPIPPSFQRAYSNESLGADPKKHKRKQFFRNQIVQYLQTVQICATIQTFMIRQHLPRRPKALPWSGYTPIPPSFQRAYSNESLGADPEPAVPASSGSPSHHPAP